MEATSTSTKIVRAENDVVFGMRGPRSTAGMKLLWEIAKEKCEAYHSSDPPERRKIEISVLQQLKETLPSDARFLMQLVPGSYKVMTEDEIQRTLGVYLKNMYVPKPSQETKNKKNVARAPLRRTLPKEASIVPTEKDVVFGLRGKSANAGIKRLRVFAKESLEAHRNADPSERHRIEFGVIQRLKETLPQDARFVMKHAPKRYHVMTEDEIQKAVANYFKGIHHRKRNQEMKKKKSLASLQRQHMFPTLPKRRRESSSNDDTIAIESRAAGSFRDSMISSKVGWKLLQKVGCRWRKNSYCLPKSKEIFTSQSDLVQYILKKSVLVLDFQSNPLPLVELKQLHRYIKFHNVYFKCAESISKALINLQDSSKILMLLEKIGFHQKTNSHFEHEHVNALVDLQQVINMIRAEPQDLTLIGQEDRKRSRREQYLSSEDEYTLRIWAAESDVSLESFDEDTMCKEAMADDEEMEEDEDSVIHCDDSNKRPAETAPASAHKKVRVSLVDPPDTSELGTVNFETEHEHSNGCPEASVAVDSCEQVSISFKEENKKLLEVNKNLQEQIEQMKMNHAMEIGAMEGSIDLKVELERARQKIKELEGPASESAKLKEELVDANKELAALHSANQQEPMELREQLSALQNRDKKQQTTIERLEIKTGKLERKIVGLKLKITGLQQLHQAEEMLRQEDSDEA